MFVYFIASYIVDILLAYHVGTISVERLACVRLTVVGHVFVGRRSREARQKRASVIDIYDYINIEENKEGFKKSLDVLFKCCAEWEVKINAGK